MKTKHLLQVPVLLILLFHSIGTSQPAFADANADTTRQLQPQPFISLTVTPMRLSVNESATGAVILNNVPAEGYTSAEFTCTYDKSLVQVSDIVVTGLFGPDPAVAIYDQQDGSFIVGMAGSQGNRAVGGSAAFTFHVKGLGTGQTALNCTARVSDGSNTLTGIGSAAIELTVAEATATPTLVPIACDKAEFLADITVPTGTVFTPGTQFTKTWRLRNVGSCTWTTSYRLAFLSGEQMGAVSSAQFPRHVAPGQVVDISINLTAPSLPGSYRGYWIFQNDTGKPFGIGLQGNQPWFVDIAVLNVTPTPSATATQSPTPTNTPGDPTVSPPSNVAFDFAAQVCAATWFSGAGQLPCPGTEGDINGFVIKLDEPKLESEAIDPHPGLLAVPQNVYNGYIRGYYPPFRVQNGDRFHTGISCEGRAMDCYVAFRLDYEVSGGPTQTFWGPFLEHYDGLSDVVDIDLSPLTGKDVRFVLTVLSVGSASDDRPLWLGPIIYRSGPGSTPTPEVSLTPTDTGTPIDDGWWGFTNWRYGFEIPYPAHSEIMPGGNDNLTRIDLPATTGTNLREKYLQIVVTENLNSCKSQLPSPQSSEQVMLNDVSFLKQSGGTSSDGHTYKWTAYSTARGSVCVSLDFVMHFIGPALPYDEAAESVVFEKMAGMFRWLATATPTSTSTLNVSATPTFTSTPFNSPTTDPQHAGMLMGQVIAGKQVNVTLLDANNRPVASVQTDSSGNYIINAPSGGTYTVIAMAPGFLRAQGFAMIDTDRTTTLPTISLLPGDIDNNDVIDPFDALTIGMNYNNTLPSAADLNNDGTINVLDLEVLARNYRKTGPVAWQD